MSRPAPEDPTGSAEQTGLPKTPPHEKKHTGSAHDGGSLRDQARDTRVAVAQMHSTPDVAQNLRMLEELAASAAKGNAKLLVVPEAFAYLGPEAGLGEVAEELDNPGTVLAFCQNLCRRHRLELIVGGFWERDPRSHAIHNACLFLHDDGRVGARYRKIHLFDADLADGTRLRESSRITPGHEAVVAQTVAGIVGLSVCYDLRFPELYRRLSDRGATTFAIPAAFTATTGKDHWQVLLRARAIEGQSYVLAAAQWGQHYEGRSSYGRALMVDPWGVVIAQCSDGVGLAFGSIQAERIHSIRNQLPSLRHRRLRG